MGPWIKWSTFCWQHFHMHFLDWKIIVFWLKFMLSLFFMVQPAGTNKKKSALVQVIAWYWTDSIQLRWPVIQYIPRNMHTVFALLCFVVVIHLLIFPYPSGLLHWHCGNLTIAPVPAKQPWWIWMNTSCEFIMNDCITTTKQSTTKPCAYFLGYTVTQFAAYMHHQTTMH